MTTAPVTLDRVAQPAEVAAGSAGEPRPAFRLFLRRPRTLAPRRRSRLALLAALGALAILFATVWERTAANALSMERDGLRRDVRELEDRIRLSTEASEHRLLVEGLDYETLGRLGFRSPDPARIVDIDLRAGRGEAAGAP